MGNTSIVADLGLVRTAKALEVEARILRSQLAPAEQGALIWHLTLCELEAQRSTVVATLRANEPIAEQAERERLTNYYNSPGQRFKMLINLIPRQALDVFIDQQVRQFAQRKRTATGKLGLLLDPLSPRYFKRPENKPGAGITSATGLLIMGFMNEYDWGKAQPAAKPSAPVAA